MKKNSLVTIIVFSVFFNVNAQDSLSINSQGNLKQQSGESALEVTFNPGNIFGSGTGSPFGLFQGGIKYRYYFKENLAIRTGLNINFSKNTEITQQADPANNILELKDKYSLFGFFLQPGIEKHFAELKRFSPYIGVQSLVGYFTQTHKEEHQDSNSKIYLTKWKNNPGNIDLGLGVLAGFDYYFMKKLYLGLEIGYGFKYSKELNIKYINEKYPDQDYKVKGGSSIGVSPSLVTGNLRLGWIF